MQVKLEGRIAAGPPAPPEPPKPPPTEEEKKRDAARKANLISAGIYFAATGAGAFASWLLNQGPKTAARGFEPVVNTATGTAQAAGARFQEIMTNPVRSWVFRAATGPGNPADSALAGSNQSKVIYPEALAAMFEVSNQRNKLNGRVSGMSDNLELYRSMLQVTCAGVRSCIAAGDLTGAARRLAGCLYPDHHIWLEQSPKSLRTYGRIYMELYPYFHKLGEAELAGFRKAVVAEAERLSGGKRQGLSEYAEAIVTGLTTRSPQKQFLHPLTLQAPGEIATISLADRPGLEQAANDEGSDEEIKKALEEHFEKLMAGKNPFQRFQLLRQLRRITKRVLAIVHERVGENGKPLPMEELWRIVQDQLNTDVSRRIENKITGISFGAFAGVGAASGIGKLYLEKAVGPQWMIGLDAVVFNLVGIAMGTAGSFFQDRFGNIARAFGYGGLEKVTMGPSVEREVLDNLLRHWTIDGRILGGRYAFIWHQRFLHEVVIDAEAAIKNGEIDKAADFLAGASEYGRRMFFSFSPLQEAFELQFIKLGPHFDVCTQAQRDELIAKVEERLKASGATPRDMAIYHVPLVSGLLTTNVATKPN